MNTFIAKLSQDPSSIDFEDTMKVIESNYDFSETRFTNGEQVNEAGSNSGSCKIFAFAKLNCLSEADTLTCFGRFYRKDVLENPDNDDHQNIRNFMKLGWAGVKFDGEALSPR